MSPPPYCILFPAFPLPSFCTFPPNAALQPRGSPRCHCDHQTAAQIGLTNHPLFAHICSEQLAVESSKVAQGLDSFTGTTDIDWEDAEMYVPQSRRRFLWVHMRCCAGSKVC